MKKKKTIILYLLVVAGLFIGGQIPSKLLFAKTNSVGHRLFYYQRDQKKPHVDRGSYVVFKITPDQHLVTEKCDPCLLTKKVGCRAGDMLKTTEQGFYYCNNQFLGAAQKQTPSGIKLTPFVFNGIVPENKFFALGGGDKYSYDSRYFGFIETKKVEGIAVPIY